jgi:hypothetical protein
VTVTVTVTVTVMTESAEVRQTGPTDRLLWLFSVQSLATSSAVRVIAKSAQFKFKFYLTTQ